MRTTTTHQARRPVCRFRGTVFHIPLCQCRLPRTGRQDYRRVSRWRRNRCHRPHSGGRVVKDMGPDRRGGKPYGGGRQYRSGYVAKANGDGYTLLMGSPAETVVNPLLYPEMQYNAQKDLAPVSQAGSAPLLLVAHPSVPATDAQGLIHYIKQNNGKVSYASSGTGGPQHLAGDLFKLMTQTNVLHVPYKGGAPAITDLVGGQVQIFFAGLPPALPFVKSGKAKALAVTTQSRSELVPDIPSLDESGLKGFDIQNWQGIFAPAGTSRAIIGKISADIRTALSGEAVKASLANQGISAAPSSPEGFKLFVDNERRKYADIIKAAHVSVK